MKKLTAFLLSAIIFITFLIAYNTYTENYIKANYRDVVARQGDLVFNQGLILQKLALEKDHTLMIYGSSELGTTDLDQHPVNFFPRQECRVQIKIVGRGYCTSLIHLMNFLAISRYLKDKKIVYIISLQWFLDKEGLTQEGFKMNFSSLHFYALMKDNAIPKELKKYVAGRVLTFTRGNKIYESENYFCRFYLSNKPYRRIILAIFKPFYEIMYYILKTKDNFKSYYLVRESIREKYLNPDQNKLHGIDWKKEMEKASEEGKKLANNNEFYIENNLFSHWYSNQYVNQKNRFLHVNLLESKEYADLEALLKFCRNEHIQPLFILMPVIGKWYDHLGLDADRRAAFYNKAETLIESYNFKTAKFPEKEYEPYLMLDSEHLGWKGWLYVNEKILKYYRES